MKKGLLLVLAVFMAFFGVSAKAMADSRTEALNVDSQFVDDIDLIWLYPNLVSQYKNTFDIRTNYETANSTWGGLLDGEHADLGTIGAYVYRPVGFDGGRQWNFGAPGWWGVGSGWYGTSWNIFQNRGYWAGEHTTMAAATPENKVDLFWGTTMDKGNFGIQINYADAQPAIGSQLANGVNYNGGYTNNLAAAGFSSEAASDDSRVLGVNLGLGMTDLGMFEQANLHLGFFLGMLNETESQTPTTPGAGTPIINNSLKDNGIYTITAGADLGHNLDQNSTMKVFGNVYLDQNNQTESLLTETTNGGPHNAAADFDETWTGKYSDIIATLGLGCNHKVLDGKATIQSGVQAMWLNSDFKNSGSTQDAAAANPTAVDVAVDEFNDDRWFLTWDASVEAQATDWLTLRAGINRPIIYRITTQTTNNTTYVANSPTSTTKTTQTTDGYFGNSGDTYSMGFAVNWQDWTVDAVATVGGVYNAIATVAPGNGILFTNNNYNNGGILTTYDADLRFKF